MCVARLLSEEICCFCVMQMNADRVLLPTSVCESEHIGVRWFFVVAWWPVNHLIAACVCMCGLAGGGLSVTGVNYQIIASLCLSVVPCLTDRQADNKQ